MKQALLAAAVLLSSVVLAQETPNSAATIDVAVSSVDVVVTGANGARLKGLTKDAFHVTEGGEQREITNFSAGTTTEGGAARRVIIAIDNMSLAMANRKRTIAAARAFIDTNLQPSDEVLVATYSVDAVVKQTWTRDRAAAGKALDAVAAEAPIGRAELQRKRVKQELDGTLSGDAAGAASQRGSTVNFEALAGSVRNYSAVRMQESAASAASIQKLLRLFPRTPQRKILVLAGEGLPLRPGSDMWEYLESLRNDLAAGSGGGSSGLRSSAQNSAPMSEANDYDLAPVVRDLATRARGAGVAVYAIRPGSSTQSSASVENQTATANTDFAQATDEAGGYRLLAQQSGGLAMIGAAPPVAFQQIADDLSSSYSIGFRSSAAAGEKPVVVKVDGAPNVRYTVIAGALTPEQQVEETVVANHTATPSSNDLGITLAADAPTTAEGGKRRVPLKILIPVRNLTFAADGKEAVGGFEVFFSNGDAKGSASDVSRQSQTLRWPADAPAALAGKSMTFAVDVVLEAGRTQISVGVLDVRSKKSGYAVIAVP